jgi:hypothetical protein
LCFQVFQQRGATGSIADSGRLRLRQIHPASVASWVTSDDLDAKSGYTAEDTGK